MPTKLFTELKHHSLVDWDFMPDHIHSLSGAQKISPPTSLKSEGAPGSGPHLPVLSRDPLAQNLSMGQTQAFFRCSEFAFIHGFSFRNQSPLGQVNADNQYFIWFAPTTWDFWQVIAGLATRLAYYNYETLPNKWYRRAVTWQTILKPDGTTPLAVRVYQFISGVWKNLPGQWETSIDYFACSPINRCGLICSRRTGVALYTDDCTIWTHRETPEELLEPAHRR